MTWPLGRAVLGLCLVLVLPGYALTAALFPPGTLGPAERTLLTLGLSLVSTMLASLAADSLSLALRPLTWAGLLAAVTVGAAAIAWRRRGEAGPQMPALNLNWVQAGTLGLAALAVASALFLTRVPSSPAGLQGYTLLWIQPGEAIRPPGVQLGLDSMEFAPAQYRLVVSLNGRPALEWPSIRLGPGQDWDGFAPLPIQDAGLVRVEATLYRLDSPAVVYRRVTLVEGPGVTP